MVFFNGCIKHAALIFVPDIRTSLQPLYQAGVKVHHIYVSLPFCKKKPFS